MGTRAVVLIHHLGIDSEILSRVYFQYDGYPTGVGKEIFDKFKEFKVGNGINFSDPEPYANGMGCFGAQFVSAMKDGPGGVYLSISESEQYVYHLYIEDKGRFYDFGVDKSYFPICMSVETGPGEIWRGKLEDFDAQELEDQMYE